MLLSGSCFAFALQMLASFWVLMCRIPVVLSGERKALLDSFMIVRNFSMFLRLQSIDMDGVISSLNFVFFSLSASYFLLFFFFIYLIFSLFSRPHTGSCVLCQCALVVEHAIAYPNDTVQYPSLIRAFDVDQPLSCCILSLEEEQAMPVCPVEL